MKFFKWVWRQIKKLGKTIATRTFLFLGFLFTWVIPIYLLKRKFCINKNR